MLTAMASRLAGARLSLFRSGLLFGLLVILPVSLGAQHSTGGYDADAAVAVSQAAIGNRLPDLTFTDSQGNAVQLAAYRGRPLLVSMIFTSCHHVCPAITQHLATAVKVAREALGEDSFQVLTIGFDTAVDTPEALRLFARKQGVDDPNWAFLSGSAETMASLVENVGFVYFPSPRGFDHINQVTVIDGDGVVYRQVYGAAFDLPWLVEPLKQLVYNRPQPNDPLGTGLLNRIKLFCTVYDPNTGRYRFDYSLFVGFGVGAVIVLALISWLVLEYRRARRREKGPPLA
jgi:protein SCO1/2